MSDVGVIRATQEAKTTPLAPDVDCLTALIIGESRQTQQVTVLPLPLRPNPPGFVPTLSHPHVTLIAHVSPHRAGHVL